VQVSDAMKQPVLTGERSQRELMPNGWGSGGAGPVGFHDDGPFGRTIRELGTDALLDVDGQPLGDVLGMLATEVVRGQRSIQQALDAVAILRERIPAQYAARGVLEHLVATENTPAADAMPEVPDGTPDYLAQLAADLYAVPMVRRGPGRELEPLLTLLDQLAVGQLIEGRRLQAELEQLGNRRHESLGDVGKFEIDRAVQTATNALSDRIAARSAKSSAGS
jgi:hypothetical protein